MTGGCSELKTRTTPGGALRLRFNVLTSFRSWWARSDLNREPKDYESSALTIELQARKTPES